MTKPACNAPRFLYADLHADALTCAPPEENFLRRKNACASLGKLVKGGCILQCFALFSRSDDAAAERRAEGWISAFLSHKSEAEEAGVEPVLTIENGGFTRGSDEWISRLSSAGVKLFGFTWNDENAFGFPCGSERGLKPLGKRAAEKILAAGILPDVSHLSDAGASEIFRLARAFRLPACASHSLCRALCPHKRNLTDEAIRRIADLGGVVGVGFVREFIGGAGIFEHLRRLIAVGGEDVAAIGTDFDGTENPLYAGADEMPRFFEEVNRSGFSPRVIEKIAYQNAFRALFGRT